jgi:hypothetical protein
VWSKIGVWLTAHSDFMNEVTYLAAMAHVGWACLIVLSAALFSALDMHWCIGVSIGMIVFGALKEYVYDAHFERPHQTFWMNTGDFIGYLGGIALAWTVISLTLHFRFHGAPIPLMTTSNDQDKRLLTLFVFGR